MENVVLIIHLLLALGIIGSVLLQRSEGGGLGIGGGGGGASGRAPATAMGKVTWGLAAAFICTSLALTIIAANNANGVSVTERVTGERSAPAPAPSSNLGTDLLPPSSDDGAITVPLAPAAPASE